MTTKSPAHDNLMPESRMRVVRGSFLVKGRNYVPIFCANCGKPEGAVPEENMTFAFVLCQPCADTWGDRVHFYLEPDAVFWRRVHEEQLSEHERTLTATELLAELSDPGSSMSKLFQEHIAKGKRIL